MFEDDRGVIEDLVTWPIDSVTRIQTKKGAIRGNHVHDKTYQWTYVLSGKLKVTNGRQTLIIGPGHMVLDEPGDPHAWQVLEDTDCLVFTRGPRSGERYESDTRRLEEPLL